MSLDAEMAPTVSRRERWLARLALASAGAAALVLLGFGGIGGLMLAAVGGAGLAGTLAGAWWFLSRHGPLRWLSAAMTLASPLMVLIIYARRHLLWVAVVSALLWLVALAVGRAALVSAGRPVATYDTPPPRHPYLIMNPRSGGGKVHKHHLAQQARALGAEVTVLEAPERADVVKLARDAVARGADLLGVAGGDGTQALVAGVAAEHHLPFLVVSAGTRNHFALDLGLDLTDPARCLDALTDGVERRVDLGLVGGHPFVNTVSFGAYAEVVQSPGYRDDKTGTALGLLPNLLVTGDGPQLEARGEGWTIDRPQALLVSNNPYQTTDLTGLGRRTRLDSGRLGVLAVRVENATQAAGLLRGKRASGVSRLAVDQLVIGSDLPRIPVGVDGEAVWASTPVHCAIAPGALRVRLPRDRPGDFTAKPEMDWRSLCRLAFGRPRPPAGGG